MLRTLFALFSLSGFLASPNQGLPRYACYLRLYAIWVSILNDAGTPRYARYLRYFRYL